MDNYLAILKALRARRDNAERVDIAWKASISAVQQVWSKTLTKKQAMDFFRSQRLNEEQQGWYQAADVYQQVIDLLEYQ